MMVNSTPVECSISDIEAKGIKEYAKYDYFKISGGMVLNAYYYEKDKYGNVDEVVYPIFSKGFIDTLAVKYSTSAEYEKYGINGFDDWAAKMHIRPIVLVKSSIKNIKESELKTKVDSLDNKLIAGTRMVKYGDISSVVKNAMLKDGIDINDPIIIEEGVSPVDSRSDGGLDLLGGVLMSGITGFLFFKRFKPKKMPVS